MSADNSARAENTPLTSAATDDSVAAVLPALGVEPGTSLLFHASFQALSRDGFIAERFLESVRRYLGTGTLAVPTLSWREVSPQNPLFHELETKSNVGILSEIFRVRFAERRSLHPTHSVAACGPHTDFLLAEHHVEGTPCAASSPWGKLAKIGTRLLLIGVDMDSCTLVHHLEERFAPDRYLREERERYLCVDRHGKSVEVCTRRHRKLYRNFWKFRDMLRESGRLREARLARTRIFGFTAADLVACCEQAFESGPDATLARPGEPGKLM